MVIKCLKLKASHHLHTSIGLNYSPFKIFFPRKIEMFINTVDAVYDCVFSNENVFSAYGKWPGSYDWITRDHPIGFI